MPLSENYISAWTKHKEAKMKTGCRFGHRTNIECDEHTDCAACGWNPAVEKARFKQFLKQRGG